MAKPFSNFLKEDNTNAGSYGSAAYEQPMHMGHPCFDCGDDVFWNLHLRARKFGEWYKEYYADTDIAAWAKHNKNATFYLRHKDLNLYRKVQST